ncbi:MAG TPA: recombination protein O N-terminal domain-containing protein [Candidatus Cloacimonadota bacterium]|nr:recombination protein O N-terminal domain-containing protein [Candidatus Cloacimonadota bacterium]HQB40220.1 recombination protein O N-terminal domain-containing protein [Candidatus Cloacimonadota bacterium]
MNYTTTAIITQKTDWKESSAIVQCFSLNFGFISFIVHGLKQARNPNQDAMQLYNELELKLTKGANAELYVLQSCSVVNRYSQNNSFKQLVCLSAVIELLRNIYISDEEINNVYNYTKRFFLFAKTIESLYLVYFARFSFNLLRIINPHITSIPCDYCQSETNHIVALDENDLAVCSVCTKDNAQVDTIEMLDSTLNFILYYPNAFWNMIENLQESELFINHFKRLLNKIFVVHYNKPIKLKALDLYY